MRMHVDEPRGDELSEGVDHLGFATDLDRLDDISLGTNGDDPPPGDGNSSPVDNPRTSEILTAPGRRPSAGLLCVGLFVCRPE